MTTRHGTDLRAQGGTRIITALERLWAAIRAEHVQVPPAVMITGSGLKRHRGTEVLTRGHHWQDRWQAVPEGREAEVFIAGETLAMGGAQVLQTMLHEAAHALAAVRGIQDTSSGGRWHNKRFAQLAREMGLEPPARTEPVRGFSACTLTGGTLAKYGRLVAELDGASLPFLPAQSGRREEPNPRAKKDPKERTAGKRLKVECGCEPPRNLQVTPHCLGQGGIRCEVCGERFAPATAEDPSEPS